MFLDYREKKIARWPTNDDLSTVVSAAISYDEGATFHTAAIQSDIPTLRAAKIGTRFAVEQLIRGSSGPVDNNAATVTATCEPIVKLTGPNSVEILYSHAGQIVVLGPGDTTPPDPGDGGVTDLTPRVVALETEYTALSGTVGTLSDGQTTLTAGQATLTAGQTALGTRVTTLEGALAAPPTAITGIVLLGPSDPDPVSPVAGVLYLRYGAVSGGGTPPPDTTAPSVPASVTASSVADTTCTLSWTASTDNVAVDHYQIFKNGTAIGTATGTSYNVTGLVAGTTYSFTVKAWDAANNSSAASSVCSVTTSNSGSITSGLFLAYNFDESSGNVIDQTGNGRDAVLSSLASRVVGHGSSGFAMTRANNSGDSDASHRTAKTTLSTSFPAATPSGISLVGWFKINNNYDRGVRFQAAGSDCFVLDFDNGPDGTHVCPRSQVDFASGGNCFLVVGSGSAIPTGVWTHIAMTWDNASGTMKIYVNGTVLATTTNPSTNVNIKTTDAINFGPESTGMDASNCATIDDFRVYTRALSSIEVGQCMTTPVPTAGGGGGGGIL